MTTSSMWATQEWLDRDKERAERCGNAPDFLSLDTDPKKCNLYDVYLNDELQNMRDLRYADCSAGVVILFETDGENSVGTFKPRKVDYERGCLMIRTIIGKVEIREKR